MQVVIIDDQSVNIKLFEALLAQQRCAYRSFMDPVEGLQWCLDHEPDLVIVDNMMPSLSGTDLVVEFRKKHPDIPVLMVTADTSPELRLQALQLGVNDFLRKPLDRVEFQTRVKNMLALRQGHKDLADRAAWLAEEVRKATADLKLQEQETVFCLAKAAEYRDPETGGHLLRMAHYAKLIAAKMGLSAHDQELLLDAAPMHDIGKVSTPDAILLKPGKLTAEEFEIMKEHATVGYNVLKDSRAPLLRMAAEIAYTHHEKYDGTGYPRGLKGEQIPLFGRIVAVADVFDALTSDRPYKKAWPLERALQLLVDGKGSHFDPVCVDVFLEDLSAVLDIRDRFADEVASTLQNHRAA